MQFTVCCLTKEEMYESYSPWKGHCFAQLPSARAARGVESQIDKSQMTLKQKAGGLQTRWDSHVQDGLCVLYCSEMTKQRKGKKKES